MSATSIIMEFPVTRLLPRLTLLRCKQSMNVFRMGRVPSQFIHSRSSCCNVGQQLFVLQTRPKPLGLYLGIITDHRRASSGHQYGRTVGFTLKSHTCGELTSSNIGEVVTLRGFLQFQRMGRFAVLRDSEGFTQILLRDKEIEMSEQLMETPLESYIEVKGVVQMRLENQFNKDLSTGEIEVLADSYRVLSKVQRKLPFLIRSHNKAKENLRLQYRYLDLRHEEVQNKLKLRSTIAKKMRDYLQDVEDFIEITTPTLSVNTPGGAQEFVVPTRHPGKFYSLVQSPQMYKQLLMIGGLERYFQFAVCYRDEGAKSDRQPEFMQVDLEVANVTMEEIQRLTENLLRHSLPSHLSFQKPFPVITYHKALSTYGVDKPDTRFEWKIRDVSKIIHDCGVTVLEEVLQSEGNRAHAFVIPDGKLVLNKKHIAEWESIAEREFNIKGPLVLHVLQDWLRGSPLTKHMSSSSQRNLVKAFRAKTADILILAVGPTSTVRSFLGKLRLLAANVLEETGKIVRDPKALNFVWVVDFPLFEYNNETGNICSVHHPFTLPKAEDAHLLYTEPLKARSQHYDLVLNGSEIGGGSIRIHDAEMQRYVVEDVLKINEHSLGFFKEALECGAPPHGGIALGFDRLITKLCGAKSIRDVIAFPKTIEGRCSMSGAPGEITKEEKLMYHLSGKNT